MSPNPPGWENQWYGAGGGNGIMLSLVLEPQLRKYTGLNFTEIGEQMGKCMQKAMGAGSGT